jgi:hypothetical protein
MFGATALLISTGEKPTSTLGVTCSHVRVFIVGPLLMNSLLLSFLFSFSFSPSFFSAVKERFASSVRNRHPFLGGRIELDFLEC